MKYQIVEISGKFAVQRKNKLIDRIFGEGKYNYLYSGGFGGAIEWFNTPSSVEQFCLMSLEKAIYFIDDLQSKEAIDRSSVNFKPVVPWIKHIVAEEAAREKLKESMDTIKERGELMNATKRFEYIVLGDMVSVTVEGKLVSKAYGNGVMSYEIRLPDGTLIKTTNEVKRVLSEKTN